MLQGAFHVDYFILLTAFLLIVGVITTKFSSRLGVPALVLFIIVGMTAGSDGFGLIFFDNVKYAQLIGIFALVIILFEGGLQTKWNTVSKVIKPSLSLATFGVILTSAIVAVSAKLILDVTWLEAFLFGAIVGSTDAAAVFAVLKGQNIKARMGATLEAESGTNDPMAVFLTLSFIELLTASDPSYIGFVGSFFWQMGIGLLLGLGLGKLASYSINQINLDSSGLYPVFAMAFALLTYSIAALMGASGLLAVYVAALIIGNNELTYRQSIFRFNEGFAWMMQILMFIILGLLVFPGQLFQFDIMLKGLLLSIILIVVARPIAVFLSTLGMNFTVKEKVFLSWAGLRGAVPIVLATFPMIAGIPNAQLFFNVVFFVVLTSTLVQGSTITMLAQKLQLTGPQKIAPIHSLELVSIGKANAEIIEFQVEQDLDMVGKTLAELKFPDKTLINAVIRSGILVTPSGDTVIKDKDFLYILTSRKSKLALEEFLKKKKPTEQEQEQEEKELSKVEN
ncbi:K(+)/H(+) antiporter NhaP2 [Bacillus sp. THAF10]|uniref:potassium/proton antiporter n=1 Tax=Bacillus sp. THAF10 TaxID=2587848 RepID=UPI001267DBF0|nr:potassium/proton antiporter [Bacillus sp. THAF10]QFT88192.1 K(+)/H(+) antiporter NhaP2 [Bacillus sp. THAF10]